MIQYKYFFETELKYMLNDAFIFIKEPILAGLYISIYFMSNTSLILFNKLINLLKISLFLVTFMIPVILPFYIVIYIHKNFLLKKAEKKKQNHNINRSQLMFDERG